MLAKVFDMDESNLYDNMSDEKLDQILNSPQSVDLSKSKRAYSYHTNKSMFEPTKEVMMRLLCPFKLNVDFEKHEVKVPPQPVDKIIIHFHGGGFVCQDSATHQIYTRQWSNEVNVPVFSVDYRLAPGNPYPDPVNDCYQAYVWIVTQAKS